MIRPFVLVACFFSLTLTAACKANIKDLSDAELDSALFGDPATKVHAKLKECLVAFATSEPGPDIMMMRSALQEPCPAYLAETVQSNTNGTLSLTVEDFANPAFGARVLELMARREKALGKTNPLDLSIPEGAAQEKPKAEECPGPRPEEPEWVRNAADDDLVKAQAMRLYYEKFTYNMINRKHDCSCQMRWPEWEAAEQSFLQLYRKEKLAVYQDLVGEGPNSIAADMTKSRVWAQELCEEQGHW
jgi:hypothetical protein